MKTFYDKLIRLSHIIRYNNIPRIHNESVAEHSFHVAALLLKLREAYYFNLGLALIIAISHDIPEYAIGDMTVETKLMFPEIKPHLEEIEEKAICMLPRWARYGCMEFKLESPEAKIVKLADAIQVKQYAEKEVRLGNGGHMTRVVKESSERIENLKKELKDYETGDNIWD